MMVKTEHFHLEIVANLVNKFNFKKGFSSYEIPNDRFLFEIFFMRKNVVDCFSCDVKSHTLLVVLTNKVAILACKLTVLCYNECNGLRNTA